MGYAFAVWPLCAALTQIVVAYVACTFVVNHPKGEAPKGGALALVGEVFGVYGQFALAYFPYDELYAVGWAAAYTALFLGAGLRLLLEGEWSGEAAAALALGDVELGQVLLNSALTLLVFWYPVAMRMTLVDRRGDLAALSQALLVLAAAGLAVGGLSLMDGFGRGSIGVLLAGEFMWAPFAGALCYCAWISVGATGARLRRGGWRLRRPSLGATGWLCIGKGESQVLKDYRFRIGAYVALQRGLLIQFLRESNARIKQVNDAQTLVKQVERDEESMESYLQGGAFPSAPTVPRGTPEDENVVEQVSKHFEQQMLDRLRLSDSDRQGLEKMNTVAWRREVQTWRPGGPAITISDTQVSEFEFLLGMGAITATGVLASLLAPSPLLGATVLLGLRYTVVDTGLRTWCQWIMGLATLGALVRGIVELAQDAPPPSPPGLS